MVLFAQMGDYAIIILLRDKVMTGKEIANKLKKLPAEELNKGTSKNCDWKYPVLP